MEQPADHSLKRFFTRVAKSILEAAIVVLGIHFVGEPSRHNPWNGLGRALLLTLIFGLVFGTLRYLADREAAINEREPNVL